MAPPPEGSVDHGHSHLSVPRGRHCHLFEERCSTQDRCQFPVQDHGYEIGKLQSLGEFFIDARRRVQHSTVSAGINPLWLLVAVLIGLGGWAAARIGC
jgi:hypothetical protein